MSAELADRRGGGGGGGYGLQLVIPTPTWPPPFLLLLILLISTLPLQALAAATPTQVAIPPLDSGSDGGERVIDVPTGASGPNPVTPTADMATSSPGPAECEEDICLAPDLVTHLRGQPDMYCGYFLLCLLAGPTVAIILVPHLRALRRANQEQPSHQGGYVLLVTAAPLVIGASKVWTIVSPRHWRIVFLAGTVYEVIGLLSFFRLVAIYLGGGVNEQVVETLSVAPPRRVWAVPPLCCLWLPLYPCMSERHVTSKDIALIKLLLLQFALVSPAAAASDVYAHMPPWVQRVIARVDSLSLLLAVYGLFALLFAAERVISKRNLHTKFWALKGLLVVNTLVFRLCTEVPHNCYYALGFCYSALTLGAARSSAITIVVLVPLTIFMRQAFPSSEIAPAQSLPGEGNGVVLPSDIRRKRAGGASQSDRSRSDPKTASAAELSTLLEDTFPMVSQDMDAYGAGRCAVGAEGI